jgi:hypothetical protein
MVATNDSEVKVDLLVRQKPKTSEEKLGLTKQPEETCPRIDKFIKEIKWAIQDLEGAMKDIGREDYKEAESDIDTALRNYIYDIEDNYESLRKQCEDIRAWGQQWKNLAKDLLNEYEPETIKDDGLSA